MRTALGFILSLLFAVGTLTFLVDSNSQSSRRLRRKLWNYSNHQSSGGSGSNSKYNKYGNYGNKNNNGNSGYSSNSNSNSQYNVYTSNDDGGSNSNYGNNYANYQDNSANNQYNNGYQDYESGNYGDDDAAYQYYNDAAAADDGVSYYDSNSNYKASGSYNGRDQYWGGQAVQNYDDDAGPYVEVEGMDDDEAKWSFFSKMGDLSAKETAAVSILAAVFSIFLLVLLGCGCTFSDICHTYCCCGLFGHKDQVISEDDPENPIVDGFVKLGDF